MCEKDQVEENGPSQPPCPDSSRSSPDRLPDPTYPTISLPRTDLRSDQGQNHQGCQQENKTRFGPGKYHPKSHPCRGKGYYQRTEAVHPCCSHPGRAVSNKKYPSSQLSQPSRGHKTEGETDQQGVHPVPPGSLRTIKPKELLPFHPLDSKSQQGEKPC